MNGTTDSDRLEWIERELAKLGPVIEALGALLVRQYDAGEAIGLHPNTLIQNKSVKKYEEVGHRRTFVDVQSIATVLQRKRRRERR